MIYNRTIRCPQVEDEFRFDSGSSAKSCSTSFIIRGTCLLINSSILLVCILLNAVCPSPRCRLVKLKSWPRPTSAMRMIPLRECVLFWEKAVIWSLSSTLWLYYTLSSPSAPSSAITVWRQEAAARSCRRRLLSFQDLFQRSMNVVNILSISTNDISIIMMDFFGQRSQSPSLEKSAFKML